MDVKLILDTETVVFSGVTEVCCVSSMLGVDGDVIFMDVALLAVVVLGSGVDLEISQLSFKRTANV